MSSPSLPSAESSIFNLRDQFDRENVGHNPKSRSEAYYDACFDRRTGIVKDPLLLDNPADYNNQAQGRLPKQPSGSSEGQRFDQVYECTPPESHRDIEAWHQVFPIVSVPHDMFKLTPLDTFGTGLFRASTIDSEALANPSPVSSVAVSRRASFRSSSRLSRVSTGSSTGFRNRPDSSMSIPSAFSGRGGGVQPQFTYCLSESTFLVQHLDVTKQRTFKVFYDLFFTLPSEPIEGFQYYAQFGEGKKDWDAELQSYSAMPQEEGDRGGVSKFLRVDRIRLDFCTEPFSAEGSDIKVFVSILYYLYWD